jgi:hypothetical protein
LDAIVRNTKAAPKRATIGGPRSAEPERARRGRPQQAAEREAAIDQQKLGIKPRDIEEFPEPLFEDRSDLPTFQTALDFQMRRHGDSYWHLHRAIV